LRRDGGIRGKRGGFNDLSIIKHLGELVLSLGTRACGVHVPVFRRHGKAARKGRYRIADVQENRRVNRQAKKIKEPQEARATFDPGGKVGDLTKGRPRAESEASFEQGQIDFDVVYAIQVRPFGGKQGRGMAWHCKT
jgi:hypothetical protein